MINGYCKRRETKTSEKYIQIFNEYNIMMHNIDYLQFDVYIGVQRCESLRSMTSIKSFKYKNS